ncbi:MAG: hypothetical protein HKN25_18100 [Pyrinomonadaceae bacterium]|nr:hypothetical protein [Pyrinomonadaceae bacterium]
MPPAARVSDWTSHFSLPLNTGPGSPNVMIGFLRAWRAVPVAAAAGLQAALTAVETTMTSLETATKTAPDPASKSTALAVETAAKTAANSTMASVMAQTGADIHICPKFASPSFVPHGPGVVLKASTTVIINNLPAARQGDKVVETLGGNNPISRGEIAVLIG